MRLALAREERAPHLWGKSLSLRLSLGGFAFARKKSIRSRGGPETSQPRWRFPLSAGYNDSEVFEGHGDGRRRDGAGREGPAERGAPEDSPLFDGEDESDAAKAESHLDAAEDAVNEAAKRVNGVWISFVLMAVYFFISTLTVTPVILFKASPVKLPIFNVDLPLLTYFLVAPAMFLAMHAYLVVLVEGLANRVWFYEEAIGKSVGSRKWKHADREARRLRLENSVIVSAMGAGARRRNTLADSGGEWIASLTLVFMPLLLMLLFQLKFLPYQDAAWTWAHRVFVLADFALCARIIWRGWPNAARIPRGQRKASMIIGPIVVFAVVIAAGFPGEPIYEMLRPLKLAVWALEGPSDPVDYAHHGSVRPFPNRMILADEQRLVEVPVSIAVSPGALANGTFAGDGHANATSKTETSGDNKWHGWDTPVVVGYDPSVASNALPSTTFSARARNFRRAVFDRSNLRGVDFSGSDLSGATMQGASLQQAKFDCAWPSHGEQHTGADGSYTNSYSPPSQCAKLERANLTESKLDDASFARASMSGLISSRATITGANFSEATLYGANFESANGDAPDFSGARLAGSNFSTATLRVANFGWAHLQGAALVNATLPAATFYSAHAQTIDASNANFEAATFESALLTYGKLDKANLKGAAFVKADLEYASLRCAHLFRTTIENEGQSKRDKLLNFGVFVSTYESELCDKRGYGSADVYGSGLGPRDDDPYDLPSERKPIDAGYSSYTQSIDYSYTSTPDILAAPEYFRSGADFDKSLNAIILNGLKETAAKQAHDQFDRLRPNSEAARHDEIDSAFWAAAVKQSVGQAADAAALANRLEYIACAAEGAPYVARGLFAAKRFEALGDEGQAVAERLAAASQTKDANCPGASGLTSDDLGVYIISTLLHPLPHMSRRIPAR